MSLCSTVVMGLALSPAPLPPRPAVRAALPALTGSALASLPLPSLADDGFGALLQSDELRQLGVFFIQTVISWGVPAAVLLFLVVATGGRGADPDEEDLPPPLAKALGLSKEPKEFLNIERLNNKLQSFDYSFEKATISREAALRSARETSFRRTWAAELAALDLDSKQLEAIEKATKRYRKAQGLIQAKLEKAQRKLRAATLAQRVDARVFDAIMREEGGEPLEESPSRPANGPIAVLSSSVGALSTTNSTANASSTTGGNGVGMMSSLKAAFELNKLSEQVTELQVKLQALDMQFLSGLSTTVSKQQALALADAIRAKGGSGGVVDVLQSMPRLYGVAGKDTADQQAHHGVTRPPRVYTISFFGDVTASQVANLRQEVTAVLRNANASEGDEVLLVLNTGGGTVTGYGLAAAQLSRVKSAGLKLTVAVEQVAASGGYMMACVADKIVASPFAVLGSIGVITEQPNVYERLKREGIEFNTITAGKFKRTLTPTKKVEIADIKKQKDDIEQVLNLFKRFVSTNRPNLEIEKVATGETWFGPDALERNLVDELATSDELLTRHVAEGYDVFSVKYSPKPSSPIAALSAGGANAASGWREALLQLAARAVLPREAKAFGTALADRAALEALENLAAGRTAPRTMGPEARFQEDSLPMVWSEGLSGSTEQPSWGWDDDFE